MDNGYDKPGQMVELLKEIRRYAGHYACITAGACEDKELRVLLARIRALDVSVVNPLLMSFFEDYVGDALSHDDFASMLSTTESYLFRRSVCDVATNSLNKFFSSVIARLNAVRDDGGNIREAYEAILLGEEGTARRMPSDAEFERALRTRDCYAFKRGFYPLTTLENSWHAKGPLDFSGLAFDAPVRFISPPCLHRRLHVVIKSVVEDYPVFVVLRQPPVPNLLVYCIEELFHHDSRGQELFSGIDPHSGEAVLIGTLL